MVEFHQKENRFISNLKNKSASAWQHTHFLNAFFYLVSNAQKEESERRSIIQHYLHRVRPHRVIIVPCLRYHSHPKGRGLQKVAHVANMSSKKKSTMTTKRSPRSSSASSSVQVVVRLRPLNDREQKHGTLPVVSASTGDKTVTVIKGQGSRQVKSSYKFDNVFTSFSTQEDVFEATLQPIIRDVLLGYESTVFAYGQVRFVSFVRFLFSFVVVFTMIIILFGMYWYVLLSHCMLLLLLLLFNSISYYAKYIIHLRSDRYGKDPYNGRGFV